MKAKSILHDTKGQVLVEFAITIPIFLVALFCFIQLVLLIHTKFMLQYAAFCAARAGIVCKANTQSMREAAAIALSPLYAKGGGPGLAKVGTGMATAMADFGRGFLSLNVLPPGQVGRLNAVRSVDELNPNEKQLKVELTYLYPLEIPIANKLFFKFFNLGINLGNYTTLSSGYFNENVFVFGNPRVALKAEYSLRITTLERNRPL